MIEPKGTPPDLSLNCPIPDDVRDLSFAWLQARFEFRIPALSAELALIDDPEKCADLYTRSLNRGVEEIHAELQAGITSCEVDTQDVDIDKLRQWLAQSCDCAEAGATMKEANLTEVTPLPPASKSSAVSAGPDPGTMARRIGVQLFRLQLANIDIGREIERLQVELESIDFSAITVSRSARKKRYGVRVSITELRRREELWSLYQRLRTAEAVSTGWERGMKKPWTREAFAEAKQISSAADVSHWVGGTLNNRSIERKIQEEISRLKAAGHTPVMS